MCGIFGISSKNPTFISETLLKKASQRLKHRGPDDEGIWLASNQQTGFAHTRLSILDLSSRGHQPFISASKKSILVYNGEIYNFKKLSEKIQLPSSTTSDTEVLVEYLEKMGGQGLKDLDGMFAFGFYSHDQILLAVDPMGKKPLFTYWDGKIFAFASEIKAFYEIPEFHPEIEKSHLAEFIVSGYIATPKSIYKNIKKLEPGHYQIFDCTHHTLMTPQKYWELPKGERNKSSYSETKMQLRNLITTAVHKRLIADVPLGVFLSGGVDSSIIAFEAQKLLSPQKIKTFTASFRNDPLFFIYDESSQAEHAAQKIKSHHLTINTDYNFDAQKILAHFDEVYADSSCFPTALLAKNVKPHVTVALSGDGGDELFGGYLRMRAGLISHYFSPLLSPFSKLTPKHFRSRQGFFPYFIRFASALSAPLLERMVAWTAFFDEKDFSSYVSQNIEKMYYESLRWSEELKDLEIGEQILHFNFKTYLANDLLPKTDRMSMLYGLEIRSPFLDKELVEFTFRIPTKYKFNCFSNKKILKDLYRPLLGSSIVDRKKKGFGFPIETLLKDKGNFQLTHSRQFFMHMPEKLSSFQGRNISSKQFLSFSLESFLKNYLEDYPGGL